MLELSLLHFAVEEKTGIAVLGLDIKTILLQAGVFLILFLIVKKYALKGIVETLEQRRTTIDTGVELGLAMEKKKAEFDEEIKQLHQAARAEVDAIIAEANKEAGEIIKASEIDASAKVDQMLKDAEARIVSEMKQARQELKQDMLNLVAEATEVIIEEKLDAKKDAGLIDRALGRLRV
jgi:F-type H+-transporting ATPase subunit b